MTATAAPVATSSGPATGSGERRDRRRLWPWALLAVAAVLVALVAGSPRRTEGRSYDPRASTEGGTKAFVTLLESFGARVEVTDRQPPADADIAVAFPGTVPEDEEADLREWVAAGHTLVLADRFSGLTPGYGQVTGLGFVGERRLPQGDCTIPAARDVLNLYVGDQSAYRFPVPSGAGGCFTSEGQAAVVSQPEGSGQIVSVGVPAVFTNRLLGEDDNAVLATSLMAPRPGVRVAYLEAPAGSIEAGDWTELVSTGVKVGLVQLGIAFAVYSFVRGRRLGKPRREPQPVEIEGSELVSAVGQLLQQTRSPDRAAAVLRGDLRRRLCERLGLGRDSPPEVIAAVAEERTGVDRGRLLYSLSDVPCPDEATLLALSQTIDAVREEVLHGRTA